MCDYISVLNDQQTIMLLYSSNIESLDIFLLFTVQQESWQAAGKIW